MVKNWDKLPPHNVEAEECVIGSLLVNGDSIYEINQFLKPDDFFTSQNKWCYECCIEIMNRGEAVDQIPLGHEFVNKGHLAEVGGVAYLSQLIAQCPTSVNILHYGRIVKNTAIARKAIIAGQKITTEGFEESDPNKIVSKAEKILLDLQKEVASPKLLTPNDLAKLATQRYNELAEGKRKGVYTGFQELDEAIGGLFGGELCYIAGRPGHGKTEWLLSVAEHVSAEYGNILLASLEQPWGDILDRYISRELNVSPRKIRVGNYSDEMMVGIQTLIGNMAASRMYFYDSGGNIDGSGYTTMSIMSLANHMKIAYGLSAVFIDYIGLIRDEVKMSLYERITIISAKLKQMARDLDIPVFCVCQLNREPEHRVDHTPQVSDLRESGALEQDADTILLLYRADKYEDELEKARENNRDIKGKADLIIGKQRQGGEASGMVIPLFWDSQKRCYKGREHASTIVPEQFR